jgi:hypothetical protein
VEEKMCDISIERRTHSTYGIQLECHECSNNETQKVYTCIRDNWVLHEYVKAMSSNGNLTAEQLSEFFYFAAETIDEVGNEFDDVNIDMIDWNELAAFYKEA